MRRRDFINLAGIATVAAPVIIQSRPTANNSEWQPDGVGSIAKIGVLTPHFDPVPESELCAMAPPGISIHSSRVHNVRGNPRNFAEPPYVDDAVEQLIDLAPRIILYAYTSSSYVLGTDGDNLLRTRLEKRSGALPIILTCQAATAALQAIGANRIAVVHPPWFTEDTNKTGMGYFTKHGFEVLFCNRVTPSRTFTEVSANDLFEWVKANVPHQTEALFIGGNGMRAVGTIQALEKTLGIPVITANQVLLWQALQLIGIANKVTQYGKLFSKR